MNLTIDSTIQITTFIGAIVTLLGAFGGTFLAAKLNNNSKKKEIYQENINKTLFLQSFLEKYIIQITDYKTNIIKPKIDNLNTSNFVKVYQRYPYTSYKIDLNMKEYSFLLKENKDLWGLLYQVLHTSESFNSTVKIHDSMSYEFKLSVDTISINKITDIVNTLATTCDNLIFFSILLYNNINILLNEIYKQKITCADCLKPLCDFDKAILSDNEKSWVEGLKNSWRNNESRNS